MGPVLAVTEALQLGPMPQPHFREAISRPKELEDLDDLEAEVRLTHAEVDLDPEDPISHECAFCGESFFDAAEVSYCSDRCWRNDR